MARYIRDEQINKPDDFVQFMMNDFLTKNGFTQKEKKGEIVWQAGVGWMSPPKFIKYSYSNGMIHIEAWMKTAWLPGVYTGENAMTGFVAAVPKSAYKKDIEELISLLYQPLPSDNNWSGQGAGQPGQPIMVRGIDHSRYATLALVFSLVSFVGIFVPIVGVIFGCMGIGYGNKSRTSSKKGMATAAFVLGIIGLVLSIIIWILNVVAIAAL